VNGKIAIGTIGNPTASIGIYDSAVRSIEKTIIDAHDEGVSSVSIRLNYLVSSGYDGKIRIWDYSKAKLIIEILIRSNNALKAYATEVCWSPDGQSVIAVTSDGHLGVWKIDLFQKQSHKVIYEHPVNTMDSMSIPGIRFIKPCIIGLKQYFIIVPIGIQSPLIVEDSTFQVKSTIALPSDRGTICAAAVSGSILYLAHESGLLSTIHIDQRTCESQTLIAPGELNPIIESNDTPIKISETEIIGIVADPETENLISFDLDGKVCFWFPKDHSTD
jgi:hypothetical protein